MSKLIYGLMLLFIGVAAGFTQAQPGMPRPVKIFYQNAGELTDDYRTIFEERLKENLFEHPLLLQKVNTPEQAEMIIRFYPDSDGEEAFAGYATFEFPDDILIERTLNQLSRLIEPLPHTDPLGIGRDPETAADIATALYDYGRGDCTQMERYLARIRFGGTAAINSRLAFFQANCTLISSDYEKAAQLFESVVYDGSAIFTHVAINLAWTYLELDQPEAAFSLMDALVNQSVPEHKAYALARRAGLHALNFDYDAGLTDINAAINLSPVDPALYVERGQIYLLLYQWDDVLADYDNALQIDPTYADAYFYRGVLYYTVVVDRDKALPDFERYLELAPDGLHAAEAAQYQADIQGQLDALNN